MRLRGRFTLWFAVAALMPIAAAALVTREVVSQSYTREFERLRLAAESNVRRELDRLESSVSGVVADMVEPNRKHPLVSGVVLELHKSAGELPQPVRRRIKSDGHDYRRGLGLDMLLVADMNGDVLAAPHHRGAEDTRDPVPGRRAQSLQGKPYYVREPVIQGDRVVSRLMVESAREYRQGRYGVVVVGGRTLEEELLGSVRQPGRVSARIVDIGDNGDNGDDAGAGEPDSTTGRYSKARVLVPSRQSWDARAADVLTVPLSGPDGRPTAIIEVAISRAELERVLMQVTLVALVLAGIALGSTVLLGWFMARRMTTNIDQLVEGAQAASRGDLDHRVAITSKDEIGAAAVSFNHMMEELKTSKERLVIAERIAAWQDIARRIAHEIKNPLTPIQMSVETLRKTWNKKHPSFDEIFEESTATVLEETARLKRIVSEFSEFARMPKPLLTACDVSEIVAGCLALYQGSVPVERSLAADLPAIAADRDQLAQVLLNLLENARDALASRAEGGRIVVETRTSERGDRVEIVVEDNGPGLADTVKDKLFTPYFTTKQGGTGLGLAIVHRMVSDHGGRIIVADAAGGGARFLIQLPVGEAPRETTIRVEPWRS